jgi:hypothetical protein
VLNSTSQVDFHFLKPLARQRTEDSISFIYRKYDRPIISTFTMEGLPNCDDGQSTAGVKLPYFHRTQSQQDKDLIGDITPKVITVLSDSSSGSRSILSSASWNAADTWEERDCSERSNENMRNIFSSDFEISCDGYCLKLGTIGKIKTLAQDIFRIFNLLTALFSIVDGYIDRYLTTLNIELISSPSIAQSVFFCDCFLCLIAPLLTEKLKGSSQVTHVRGKARFFYDYSFELSFKVSNSSAQGFTGQLQQLLHY